MSMPLVAGGRGGNRDLVCWCLLLKSANVYALITDEVAREGRKPRPRTLGDDNHT
jgi:hypothetical protein